MKQGNVKEAGPVLGIEGGGTKTRWILLDPRGRRLAEGVEGPGNVLLTGHEGLRKIFRRIATRLPRAPQAIGGGFAGARGPAEMALVRAALQGRPNQGHLRGATRPGEAAPDGLRRTG